MTNAQPIWRIQHSIQTTATPAAIWRVLVDVPGWKRWNRGIETIELDGPFEAGTWFTMKPPGQAPLRSRLVDVRANEAFVDETRVGDLVVTVAHRLEPLGAGRTRVTYEVEAAGPEASEVGPVVASDFPEVLAALAALVEGKSE